MLHRLGADASLSLGNKKAVDIAVVQEAGVAVPIDVKGVAGPHDWPADNVTIPEHNRRFFVLVSFEGRIADPAQLPSVWVVPARELGQFIRQYRGRKVISKAAVRATGRQYANCLAKLLELNLQREPTQ